MPDFAAMPAALAPSATEASNAPTSVSLFDQGLTQVLDAAVSGLQPKQPYVLALAENPDGGRAAAAAILHDEPGWRGDRQFDRSDSAARRDRCKSTAPLSGDRASNRHYAWHSCPDAGPVTNGHPPAIDGSADGRPLRFCCANRAV